MIPLSSEKTGYQYFSKVSQMIQGCCQNRESLVLIKHSGKKKNHKFPLAIFYKDDTFWREIFYTLFFLSATPGQLFFFFFNISKILIGGNITVPDQSGGLLARRLGWSPEMKGRCRQTEILKAKKHLRNGALRDHLQDGRPHSQGECEKQPRSGDYLDHL